MKKHQFAKFLGIALAVFTVLGCSNSVADSSNNGGGNVGTVTVTFKDDGEVIKTIELNSGDTLKSVTSQLPINPSKSGNYFLYWSKSRASQADAIEFTNNTPVTEDTTLYATYTPRIYSSADMVIEELTYTYITIKLNTNEAYPLEDGSYAGLTVKHLIDGSNSQPVTTGNIPTDSYEDEYYRYLKFNFSSPLTKGNHSFIISNTQYTVTKTRTITIAYEDVRTVTFYNPNRTTVKKTVEVEKNTALSLLEIPEISSDYKNYFMYWSKSAASKSAAVEFNLGSTISENIILYPILTPKLSSINTVYPTELQLMLNYQDVYPLDDGSYAGIVFEHSTDNSTWETLSFDVPDEVLDTNGDYYHNRYLTYYFANNFSAGTHYFRASNGHETKSYNITISSNPVATNLTALTDDQFVKVTFTSVDRWIRYTVKAYKGNAEVASKTIKTNSTSDPNSVDFLCLENGTEYTFKVFTLGSDVVSDPITATPAAPTEKKASDWLVILYMDGDNNLHEPIYVDINEAEYGLYEIRNNDGSAKSAYDSVNVVALWDGVVSFESVDDDGNPIDVTPVIGQSGSYIFELGADNRKANTIEGCNLSRNTKNLSHTADWLVDSSKISATGDSDSVCGEVNMGDKQTLINYLNWVNARYTANKGVILQFSDHGGGPRNVIYAEMPDGRTIKVNDNSGRRALCWDDTNSSAFLKTKDVSEALATVGYGSTKNKLAMILMDVCLGSSIEDAYQFKDYANYLAASPNTIPGNGLDYVDLMKGFKNGTTIDAISKQIVSDYRKQYGPASKNYKDYWNYYAYMVFETNYDSLLSEQKEILEWLGDLGLPTFTITDLSEVSSLKNSIDAMCDIMLSTTGKSKTVYVNSQGIISPTVTESTKPFVKYLGSHHADILGMSNIKDVMYYQGSFTWLYDIGYIADQIKYCTANSINGTANANAWSELYTAADDVVKALNQVVKYSWRDSKLNASFDFYCQIEGSTDNASDFNHYYGLTTAGYGLALNAGEIVQGTMPRWYKTDLAYGKESKWGDLLTYWFGAQ